MLIVLFFYFREILCGNSNFIRKTKTAANPGNMGNTAISGRYRFALPSTLIISLLTENPQFLFRPLYGKTDQE